MLDHQNMRNYLMPMNNEKYENICMQIMSP